MSRGDEPLAQMRSLKCQLSFAGLDHAAMMGELVEGRRRHRGVAKHAWPFSDGKVRGDDDRGLLIGVAALVEEKSWPPE